MSRSKTVFNNLLSSIVLQVVTILSGFLLPHFFLLQYGSSINGMISSVTQVLTYLALVESGISAASIVELYKPLSENNLEGRNTVLSATRKFYLQSGYIYTLLLAVLLIFYPLLIATQVDSITTRIMIIILAASNLVDYFWLGKYRVLLTANQQLYIINNVQSIGTVANTIITLLLISFDQNVLLVKAVATLVYIARAIVVVVYVRKHFKSISFKEPTTKNVLPQRWNALFHQVVGVICNNTDIILITICLGSRSLLEVSVYYIYSLVGNAITSLFNSVSNGVLATFGEMFASGKESDLKRSYDVFEFSFFIVLSIIYMCMFVLLLPFVKLYTLGVNDANYIRPILAVLFVLMGVIQNIRIPSLTMICAAGHYKQTQFRALTEAIINLAVSLLLIFKFGIAGAVIGTIASYLYRTTDCIIYNSSKLVKGTVKNTVLRLIRNLSIAAIEAILLFNYMDKMVASWGQFVAWGFALVIGSSIVIILVNMIFEPKNMKQLFQYARRALSKIM